MLNNAGVRFAVVQDQEQVDKLQSMADEIPLLTDIIFDEPRGLRDYDRTHLHDYSSVQDRGRQVAQTDTSAVADWEAAIRASDGSEISAILYTSGTTGRSKGVMLSAAASVKAAEDTAAFDNMSERDEVLAYLPLAWVGDHYLNYAQGYVVGLCMSCPESPDTVAQNLREIGPSFYFAPPRVFEGLLTSVIDPHGGRKPAEEMAVRALSQDRQGPWRKDPGGTSGLPLSGRISYWIGDKLIYGPLRNVLGFTRIRTAYTAGEAIGPDLFSFFRSLGINLKQLYGQTEAFLYVTCQKDGDVRPDTVGPAAPDVDIRITESGEVQFRSPGMFAGYYGDEDKTRETMTDDGWVMTGDAGIFRCAGGT